MGAAIEGSRHTTQSRGSRGAGADLPGNRGYPDGAWSTEAPLISEPDGQKRTWRIGAVSSPLLTVPWSVVETEQPRMVGSETTRPRHESYGDCDAEVRVIVGTGMDTSGSTASHATIN